MFKESTYLNGDTWCWAFGGLLRSIASKCFVPFVILGVISFFVYQPLIFILVGILLALHAAAFFCELILTPLCMLFNTWHKIALTVSWIISLAMILTRHSTTFRVMFIMFTLLLTWYEMLRRIVLLSGEMKDYLKESRREYLHHAKHFKYRPINDPVYYCIFHKRRDIIFTAAKIASWMSAMYYLFLNVKLVKSSSDSYVYEENMLMLAAKFLILLGIIWVNAIIQEEVVPCLIRGAYHGKPFGWCACFVIYAVILYHYQIELVPAWLSAVIVVVSLICMAVLFCKGVKYRSQLFMIRRKFKKEHKGDPDAGYKVHNEDWATEKVIERYNLR